MGRFDECALAVAIARERDRGFEWSSSGEVARERGLAIEFSKSLGMVPKFICTGFIFRINAWTFQYFGCDLIFMSIGTCL